MSYGADTDYFGFADTNNKLISSSKVPAKSEAQAMDSNADVVASTMYDTFNEISCEYEHIIDAAIVLYDTATAVDFRVGKVISSQVIGTITVTSDNTSRKRITIAGRSTSSSDGNVAKYDPTSLEITGTRAATGVGITEDTVTNVIGSSTTMSSNFAVSLDSTGNEAALDVYGGRIEASNDLVGVTGNAGAAADTGWTINSGPGNDQENTGYETGSVTVFKNLAKM